MPQVLPDAVSSKLLRMLEGHAKLKAYTQKVNLGRSIPLPNGLVLLLCGPSGSGTRRRSSEK